MSALPSRWPLFARIFAVLFVSVIVVQLVSYGLLSAAGPPAAAVRTIDEVAAALRLGQDSSGAFDLSVQSTLPPADLQNPFAGALAKKLGVAVDRVRVSREDHMHGPPITPLIGGPGAHAPHDVRAEVLFGRFSAALKRADGRWLVARAKSVDWEIWRRNAFLWLLGAALAVVPFALLLARWLARPYKVFAAAADRLGRDPHAPMLAVDGPPEIAHAAEAFNEMQRRLSRYVEDRTMLIGAIAHDMRTPLTRLSLRSKDAPIELRAGFDADIRDMDAMIRAATSFVEDSTRPTERRLLELRSLVASVTDGLIDMGHLVSLAPGDPITMMGNPTAIKAAITNLVGNALKYAGDAEVLVFTDHKKALIEVRDHGQGIPIGDLERVFEPFFRGEASRNRETGGLGLGLASVRSVALAHGGEIVIQNHPEGGAVARLSLPCHCFCVSAQVKAASNDRLLASFVKRSSLKGEVYARAASRALAVRALRALRPSRSGHERVQAARPVRETSRHSAIVANAVSVKKRKGGCYSVP